MTTAEHKKFNIQRSSRIDHVVSGEIELHLSSQGDGLNGDALYQSQHFPVNRLRPVRGQNPDGLTLCLAFALRDNPQGSDRSLC